MMDLKAMFLELLVEHIPQAKNTKAGLLAKLASIKTEGQQNSVVVHTLANPSTHLTSMSQLVIKQ